MGIRIVNSRLVTFLTLIHLAFFSEMLYGQVKTPSNTGLLIVAGSPDSDRHLLFMKNSIDRFLANGGKYVQILAPKYLFPSPGNSFYLESVVQRFTDGLIRAGLNVDSYESDGRLSVHELDQPVGREVLTWSSIKGIEKTETVPSNDPVKVKLTAIAANFKAKNIIHIELLGTGHGPRFNSYNYYKQDGPIFYCSILSKPGYIRVPSLSTNNLCVNKSDGNEGSGIGWHYSVRNTISDLNPTNDYQTVIFTQRFSEIFESLRDLTRGGSIVSISLTCFSRIHISAFDKLDSYKNSCGVSTTHPRNAHMADEKHKFRPNLTDWFSGGITVTSDLGVQEIQKSAYQGNDNWLRSVNKRAVLANNINFSTFPMNLLRMKQIGINYDVSNFSQWRTSSYVYLEKNFDSYQPYYVDNIINLPGNPYNPDAKDPRGKKRMCEPEHGIESIKKAFMILFKSIQLTPNSVKQSDFFDPDFFWNKESQTDDGCKVQDGNQIGCESASSETSYRPRIKIHKLTFPGLTAAQTSYLTSLQNEIISLLMDPPNDPIRSFDKNLTYLLTLKNAFTVDHNTKLLEPLRIYTTYRYLYLLSAALNSPNSKVKQDVTSLLNCESIPFYSFLQN